MHRTAASTLQTIACFVVAAAGLVPVVHMNRPFWGLNCISFDQGAPKVYQVEEDSPAKAAGLLEDDVILSVNGSGIDYSGLAAILDSLKPGETVPLRVRRGEAEMDVSVSGIAPPVAMIYYPSIWHPVAGLVGLTLALLVIATEPMRPAPRWRAALLGAGGLALAVCFFVAIAHNNVFSYWQIRRYHTLNWGAKWHFEQAWVGLLASLALAVLGTCELRRLLRQPGAAESGPPNSPPQEAGPA